MKIDKKYLEEINACEDAIKLIGDKEYDFMRVWKWCKKNNIDWAVWILGHYRISEIKLLIESGANINMQDHNGETVLMHAGGNNRIESLQLLLDHGADINIQDNFGRTALMFAVGNNRIEIVQLLIEYGADINIQDNDGMTISMLAKKFGYPKIIKLLEDKENENRQKISY